MLTVRWLHVLGMALALGGAVLTWGVFRRFASEAGSVVEREAALGVATAYEWTFWTSMGVLVMTGVGNLGSLAPYVPVAGTRWGTVFALKLLAVMAVLALSVVRTVAVHRRRRAATASESNARTLRVGYAATAVALAGIVALAEVLAHG